jgi:ABC-2 type transport system ATP-binding protein
MFEADSLCQRVAVINKGNIVALDTPQALKAHAADLSVVDVEVFGIPVEVVERVRSQSFVDTLSVENVDQRQMLHIQTKRGSEAVPDLLHLLNGLRVGKVTVREPTLEDAYVRLVGGEA